MVFGLPGIGVRLAAERVFGLRGMRTNERVRDCRDNGNRRDEVENDGTARTLGRDNDGLAGNT
jgi:hypothetical protein